VHQHRAPARVVAAPGGQLTEVGLQSPFEIGSVHPPALPDRADLRDDAIDDAAPGPADESCHVSGNSNDGWRLPASTARPRNIPEFGRARQSETVPSGPTARARHRCALNNLGGLQLLRNDTEAAVATFTEAGELLAPTGDRYNYAATRVGLASAHRDRGRYRDALDSLLEAKTAYEQLGDANAIGTTIGAIALTYHMAGETAAADATYRTALVIFVARDDRIGIAKTLGNLALVCQESGDLDEALERMREALEEYRALGDRHGEAVTLVNLARLHEKRGEIDTARRAASQARAACIQYGYQDQLERLG
jgi:Flp pilus assembly protein TadD